MPNPPPWPVEDDNHIREGVAAGHSYRHIAEKILGGRRTRDAVIGRAHRLGIKHTLTEERRRAAALRGKPKAVVKVRQTRQTLPPVLEPIIVREVLDDLGPTILELAFGQCKWPTVQDKAGVHRFCAEPVRKAGAVYCAHHHEIGWRPARR